MGARTGFFGTRLRERKGRLRPSRRAATEDGSVTVAPVIPVRPLVIHARRAGELQAVRQPDPAA